MFFRAICPELPPYLIFRRLVAPSVVTRHPAKSKISINSGSAVISFDLPSTFFYPNTNLFLVAHALTILIAPFPFLLSPELFYFSVK